jgi:hypothetical protein
MVQTRGTMNVFKELPKNSERRQAPAPPPQAPIALNQLLATQNALM